MPSRLVLVVTLAAAAALAGCANQPMPGENPTPARSSPAVPPPTGSASGGGSGGVNTYGAATPDPDTGVTLQDEEGNTTQARSDAQKQKDAEDCYTYAQASVARDIQVQDDRQAIFDTSSNNRDVYAFTSRMTEYGNEQRRGELYADCMASKGYIGGQ
jgi:hypothetical protein